MTVRADGLIKSHLSTPHWGGFFYPRILHTRSNNTCTAQVVNTVLTEPDLIRFIVSRHFVFKSRIEYSFWGEMRGFAMHKSDEWCMSRAWKLMLTGQTTFTASPPLIIENNKIAIKLSLLYGEQARNGHLDSISSVSAMCWRSELEWSRLVYLTELLPHFFPLIYNYTKYTDFIASHTIHLNHMRLISNGDWSTVSHFYSTTARCPWHQQENLTVAKYLTIIIHQITTRILLYIFISTTRANNLYVKTTENLTRNRQQKVRWKCWWIELTCSIVQSLYINKMIFFQWDRIFCCILVTITIRLILTMLIIETKFSASIFCKKKN